MTIMQFIGQTLITSLWYAAVLNTTAYFLGPNVFTAGFMLSAAALHCLLYVAVDIGIDAVENLLKG